MTIYLVGVDVVYMCLEEWLKNNINCRIDEVKY